MCQEWIDKLTQFSTVYALASPRTHPALPRQAISHCISQYPPYVSLYLPHDGQTSTESSEIVQGS